MRIAHVISGLDASSGGPSTVCLELARWQSLLGARCTILTARHDGPSFDAVPARDAGVSLVELEPTGPGRLRDILRCTPDMGPWLKEHGPSHDLFVLHGAYQYPTFRASLYCRRHNKPYIFTPHGSLDPAVRGKHARRNRCIDALYHDNLIRNAAAWHFTSVEERLACERPIWRNSFVEPLGIDIDALPPGPRSNAFRQRHAIPADAPLFLFLSRITRKKGIDILLNAFRRLTGDRADVHLALCGPVDADLASMVAGAVAESGGRLIAPGMVLGDEKRAAFLDADYFVLPTYSENFGVAVLEAMAYGLPVITTTGMNIHTMLAQSGRTRIIEPDAASLHATMRDVMAEPWIPAESVETTRLWLQDNFSWKARADHLLRHYEDAMKGSEP